MPGTWFAAAMIDGRLKLVSRCKPWALAGPPSKGSGRSVEPAVVLPAANRASGIVWLHRVEVDPRLEPPERIVGKG